MRTNAASITYDEAILLGEPVLFTDYRLDPTTTPPQLYLYEIRHAYDDSGLPCQIAKGILVNFYGSILAMKPLNHPADGYLDNVKPPTRWIYASSRAWSFPRSITPSVFTTLLSQDVSVGTWPYWYSGVASTPTFWNVTRRKSTP